jgi:putative peptide zinc metalloprotease protein
MKFDGYYMLSDLWQVPNLQARSGALAQWWLRETLFGLGRAPPDAFPRPHRRWLIAYAICAWVYRFFLFLGIAILVYYAVFKALGVVLFAIEIIWFILLPIYREMREWWSMRTIILGMRRTLVSASVAAIALALLLVPWSSTVRIQGMAAAEAQTRLFAPRSGRIDRIAVSDRQPVIAGETLLVLSAPDLHHEIGQAQRRIALTQARLQRIAGDVTDRAERVVLEVELQRHRESMAGLEAELDRLVIRSPGAGVVRDLDRDLRPGEWIDDVTPIARVVGGGRQQVLGYVDEHDLWRIPLGAEAVFISEDPLASRRQGRVVEVAPAGARAVDHLILASVYGGAVPADRAPDGVIKPRSGQHQVRIEINGPVPERAERGMVHLSGARESIAAAIWRRLLQVLVRESSA